MKRTTPSAHRSDSFPPFFFSITSGGRYGSVPRLSMPYVC